MFRLWRLIFAVPLALMWTCMHQVDRSMSVAARDPEPRAVYADTREPYVPPSDTSLDDDRPREQVPGKPMLDPTPRGDRRPW